MFTTSNETPSQVEIKIGISDDINTEITSGLNEGDQIVLKTTTSTSTKKTTQSSSLLGGTNIKGVGGGANFPR
jgi:macrolide-specific efflux system membrane fusion protein